MGVRGNWGVEIIDSTDVYEKPEKRFEIYTGETKIFKNYKSGCGC